MATLLDLLTNTRSAAQKALSQGVATINTLLKQGAAQKKAAKAPVSTAPVDVSYGLGGVNYGKTPPVSAPVEAVLRAPTQKESNKISMEAFKANPTVAGGFNLLNSLNTQLGSAIQQKVVNPAPTTQQQVQRNLNLGTLPARIASGLFPGAARATEAVTRPVLSSGEKALNYVNASDEYKTKNPLEGLAALGSTAYEAAMLYGGLAKGAGGTLASLASPRIVSGLAAAAPQDVQEFIRPGLEAYSVVKSPDKVLAGLNVAAGRATDPLSNLVNRSNLSQPVKDIANLGINVGENLLAYKGAKAFAPSQAGIQAGYQAYKSGAPALDVVDTALKARDDFVAASKPQVTGQTTGEVLGFKSPKTRVVDQLDLEPKFADGDIVGKQRYLERLLGLAPTVDSKDLEGMSTAGSFLGSARKAKNTVASAIFGKDAVGEGGIIQTTTQRAREVAQDKASKLMSSDSPAGSLTRGFKLVAGKTGKTADRLDAVGNLKGQLSVTNDLTRRLSEEVYELTNKAPESLAKIHAVLDPELATKESKAARVTLTPNEAKAVTLLRTASDLINDINYKNNFITKEQWQSNKGGRYIARAYKSYDFAVPESVKKLGVKPFDPVELGMFKSRKELTDWMKQDAIRDPAWLMSKRIHETLTNDAVKKYYSYVATKPEFFSKESKPGFTKVDLFKPGDDKGKFIDEIIKEQYGNDIPPKELSDLRAKLANEYSDDALIARQKALYGDLAGKYVRQDVLEDVRGFYFNNQLLQAIYDGLKMYNRFGPRVAVKKLKTVLNPVVRLGNRFGGVVFANFMGVNPATFLANYAKVGKGNTKLWRTLQARGVLGTDYAKSEIRQAAKDIAQGTMKEAGVLDKVDQAISSSYGRVDDRGKVAIAKTLLDRGYSFDYVVSQLRQGTQNYDDVGKLFDVGSKLPIFGKPFGKFGSNAVMIMKNALLNRPLRTTGTLLLMKAVADMSSAMSGETEEDRKTREGRLGSPHIPFSGLFVEGGVPLTVQTPLGEINIGRMFGLQSLNTERGQSLWDDLMTYSPIDDSLTSDVLAGPLLTTAGAVGAMFNGKRNSFEEDFRGKSIRDPDMTPYQRDTFLPVKDQAYNIGAFLGRSFAPQPVNDIYDIYTATAGKEDFYGRSKTPLQAASRAAGIKVEQFGKKEAAAQREKELFYNKKDESEQNRFDMKYIVSQAAKKKEFDDARLQEVKDAYIKSKAYVSDEEISEAMKQEKNKGKEIEEVKARLALSKIKTSIREANSMLISDMIKEGKANRGSQDVLRKKIETLMKENVSSYSDPKDAVEYLKRTIKDLESSW